MTSSRDAADDIRELSAPLAAFTAGLTHVVDNTIGTENVTDAEMLAIAALIRERSISTTDLRRRSGLSRRAHDHLVNQLLADELIERRPAPDDRRRQLLILTRRGHNRARTLDQRVVDYLANSRHLVDEIIAILAGPRQNPPPTTDAAPSDPLEVLERAAKLGNTFDAAIRAQRAPHHPKDRDQNALLLIAAHPNARPSRMAEQMNLSSAGLTYVLDRLEEVGLIVRSHGQIPGDRRAVVIELTHDGRTVIDAIAAGLATAKPDFLAYFTMVAEYSRAGSPSQPTTGGPTAARSSHDSS